MDINTVEEVKRAYYKNYREKNKKEMAAKRKEYDTRHWEKKLEALTKVE